MPLAGSKECLQSHYWGCRFGVPDTEDSKQQCIQLETCRSPVEVLLECVCFFVISINFLRKITVDHWTLNVRPKFAEHSDVCSRYETVSLACFFVNCPLLRYRILLEPSPESDGGDSQRSTVDVQYE